MSRTMRGATWRLVNSEQRLWGRGWYFGQIAVDPTNPDRAYDINTATYMTARCGQDVGSGKGRAGRRRLPPALDQSQGRQPHGAFQRPGHRRLRRRREDLEYLVQPADRTRFTMSLPTIASPTGFTARSRIQARLA